MGIIIFIIMIIMGFIIIYIITIIIIIILIIMGIIIIMIITGIIIMIIMGFIIIYSIYIIHIIYIITIIIIIIIILIIMGIIIIIMGIIIMIIMINMIIDIIIMIICIFLEKEPCTAIRCWPCPIIESHQVGRAGTRWWPWTAQTEKWWRLGTTRWVLNPQLAPLMGEEWFRSRNNHICVLLNIWAVIGEAVDASSPSKVSQERTPGRWRTVTVITCSVV